MRTAVDGRRGVGAGALALLISVMGAGAAHAAGEPVVVASGLNSPRQLTFSPGGGLYVAEAGTAGPDDGNCQDQEELGHVCFGLTGSVARIGSDGSLERIVTDLPSAGSPGEVVGPSDLVFTGNHRFALVIGLGGTPEYREGFGPSAGLLGTVVTGDTREHKGAGKVQQVFDVAGYEAANNPDGGAVDSNGVGIARSGNGWVVADAGGNDIVSTRGDGSTLAVLPPVPTTQPGPFGGTPPAGFPAEAVPTDAVRGPDGAWYVSQLVGFPFEKGSSTIWRLAPGGAPQPWATGLTNVTSLAFGGDGTLYAVELASDGLLSGPTGSLVEVSPGASTHPVVAGGLFAPYGVAIRGASAYVTTGSVAAGGGQVVKIGL